MRRGAVAAIADYALQPGCRRKKLLAHFGEVRGPCNTHVEIPCDHCSNSRKVLNDLTKLDKFAEEQLIAAANSRDNALCCHLSTTQTTSGIRHEGKASLLGHSRIRMSLHSTGGILQALKMALALLGVTQIHFQVRNGLSGNLRQPVNNGLMG